MKGDIVMHEVQLDKDGELILTYDVSVDCHGKRVLHLGSGHSAVEKFCDIVSEGIPEANKIDCLWENNYLVTISGDGLIAFLEKNYPEKMLSAKKRVDPREEYIIDCYDMS